MKEIIIKNLKIFAYHGVHKEEKINGQNFYIDAVYQIAEPKNGIKDDIENTVSYSDVIKFIKKNMLIKSFDLIEAAADNLCAKIFENFPNILKIEIILKKPEAPINEIFDYVAVKTSRKRSDYIQ